MQLFVFQNLLTNKFYFCFSEENDCIKQEDCYIILKKLAIFRYGQKSVRQREIMDFIVITSSSLGFNSSTNFSFLLYVLKELF